MATRDRGNNDEIAPNKMSSIIGKDWAIHRKTGPFNQPGQISIRVAD